MSRVRIKICGIGHPHEALRAAELGADALGFNFWPRSSRFITPANAKSIIKELPPFITTVGVFVNETVDNIRETIAETGINTVQLHGDEPPEMCIALEGVKVIKAIRVDNGFDPSLIVRYSVSAILLDSSVKGQYGGTGERFDWKIALEAKQFAPIILAGGIAIENVRRAIEAVAPMAVDVCSGVESEPGKKDIAKLEAFLAEATRDRSRVHV